MTMGLSRAAGGTREPGPEGRDIEWPSLTPRLYGDLRRIAAAQLRKERLNHTLQATEIAHEAWLRLSREKGNPGREPGHYLALCSINIRRVLIEHGRRRGVAGKHGFVGNSDRADLMATPESNARLTALDEALAELARKSPGLARTVELRFFVGLTLGQIATLEGVNVRTIKRRWSAARLYLAHSLDRSRD